MGPPAPIVQTAWVGPGPGTRLGGPVIDVLALRRRLRPGPPGRRGPRQVVEVGGFA